MVILLNSKVSIMFKPILISITIIIFISLSCKHTPLSTNNNSNNNSVVTNSMNCDPDTVYFVNDILPIMISNCTMSGCHDVTSHKEGVILNSYSNIMSTADVEPGKAASSDLYKVLIKSDPDEVMPQPPLSPLSASQIAMVKKWIEQGARNNSCSSCDTAGEMKYSMHIVPVLQANCTGCHSASSAGGGIDLTNYAGVQLIAANASLMGSIKHIAGYSAMPKNGSKLSDCEIIKIQKWVSNGSQNN
jgi:cytochrome c553